ncbi:MAG: glycosyltransferase family 2 protein [Elusimicrobiales bacterium]|nr:glycosyltransferase family 2 protein [Elusimicrobiales bacterium]
MTIHVSAVIPVFNEEENLAGLEAELSAALAGLKRPCEVIWVDDGSTDGSFARLRQFALKPGQRALRLSKNYGQTAALAAGIAAAKGEWIVTLDADGQNDPDDIARLLAAAAAGPDVVSGWRKNRRDAFFTRILPSRAANAVISAVTGLKLHDFGCTLKVYRASLLKAADLYGEMHRFLPAILAYAGASVTELEVNHRPRRAGRSKYGLFRTFKVVLDLLTVKFMGDFITKPIYLFGGLSLALLAASALMAGYTLYNKFAHHVFVKDQPLFLLAIFFALVAVQFAALGLLAEVLIRTYHSSNRRPPYTVAEEAGQTAP